MIKEEIDVMKNEVEKVKCESKSFAFELLSELKKRAKRDFIIILVELVIIILSNIGWFIYTTDLDYSTTSYDEITQEQENTNNSSMIGEIH